MHTEVGSSEISLPAFRKKALAKATGILDEPDSVSRHFDSNSMFRLIHTHARFISDTLICQSSCRLDKVVEFIINRVTTSNIRDCIRCIDLLTEICSISGLEMRDMVLGHPFLFSRCVYIWETLGKTNLSDLELDGCEEERSLLQHGKLIIFAFMRVMEFERILNLSSLSTTDKIKVGGINMHMANERRRLLASIGERLGERITSGDKSDLDFKIREVDETLEILNYRNGELVKFAQKEFEEFLADHLQYERYEKGNLFT